MPTGLAKSEEHVQRDNGENKRLIFGNHYYYYFTLDSLSLWDPSQSQQTMNVEADLWGCKNYEIMETEWKRKGIEQTEGIRWKWRERERWRWIERGRARAGTQMETTHIGLPDTALLP